MKRLISLAALAMAMTISAATPEEIISEVKKSVARDSRQTVFEITAEASTSGATVLRGNTSEDSARKALREAFDRAGIEYIDSVNVYPAADMALVSIPVATLRTRPAHAGEVSTQAVMGTPVRILEESRGWYRAQTPDGYIAWVPTSSLVPKTADEMAAWRRASDRYVVKNLWQTHAFTAPDECGPRDVVTDLVLGAIVQSDGRTENGRMLVTLPDGRKGWADTADLEPITMWADQRFDAKVILNTAYSLEGSPYLWGGTSIKSVDCSGLVKVSYLNNGIILRRDASQQALTGEKLDPADWSGYEAGDLLFFGDSASGRVTHVAIYDNNAGYIHSSGRVKRNSLDPESTSYLYSPLSVSRIHGCEGTDGIVRVINHPWYF